MMAPTAANKLLDGKVKVGSDATAAAGSGASASTGTADMLTYSRTSGLFAGVSLDGASLEPDKDANQRLYDKAVSARDIVGGGVSPTPAGTGTGIPAEQQGVATALSGTCGNQAWEALEGERYGT